jgi:hypothetical protein
MARQDTPATTSRGAGAQVSGSGLRGFLLSRWRGEAPLGTVFWRDMLVIGTGLNVLTGLAAMAMLAADMSTALALAVHFSLLPWNLFLMLSVWRSAEKAPPSQATVAKFGSLLWLPLAILI